jgi:Zn-dependent protease with chaperone function
VLGLIFGGTMLEMNSLRAGGSVVAKMVNGREVDPSTRDLLDRRLVNVVEEMAIASGVPVPRVYVLDDETAINAFAAGHSINDAVIAVTRGTLTRLSRDELQGVIAHEFSHVLNGDMRLNLRLIGVLYGLMVVALAGRFLLEIGGRGRSGSGRSSGGALAVMFLAGLSLWVLGYIGVFFGRLIKAAVSRQREFLADASAVQFTRNPDGIGGALRRSADSGAASGSNADQPSAGEARFNLSWAQRGRFRAGLFATHCRWKRVQRIYGRRMDFTGAGKCGRAVDGRARTAPESSALDRTDPVRAIDAADASRPLQPVRRRSGRAFAGCGIVAAGAAAASQLSRSAGTVRPPAQPDFTLDDGQRATLATLRRAATDATRAQLLVCALLVDQDVELRAQQRQVISEAYGAEGALLVEDLHLQVQQLPPGASQPLVDVAMPALRKLPAQSRASLLKLIHLLVIADGRLTVPEFLLYTILKRRLGPDAGRAVHVKFQSVQELPREAGLLLSLVARVRLPERVEHAFNAGALLLPGGLSVVAADDIRLDEVSAALDRLNQLASRPQLIKARGRRAFIDGETNWRAASTLRMICAALDVPLPPQVLAIEGQ